MLTDLIWSTFSVFLADKSRIFAIWAVSVQMNSLPHTYMFSWCHWAHYLHAGNTCLLAGKRASQNPELSYSSEVKSESVASVVGTEKATYKFYSFLLIHVCVRKVIYKHTHMGMFGFVCVFVCWCTKSARREKQCCVQVIGLKSTFDIFCFLME